MVAKTDGVLYACHEYQSVRYRILTFLGFPRYRVGTDGTVWTNNKKGGANQWSIGDWKLLALKKDRHGYLLVSLCHDGKYTTFQVSHLVLLAFVSSRPDKHEACHFPNQNPTNNNVNNLRWNTRVGNQKDRIDNKTDQCGERHSQAKLNWDKVSTIRSLYATGQYTLRELANKFNVKQMCISQVVNNKTWNRKEGTHVS